MKRQHDYISLDIGKGKEIIRNLAAAGIILILCALIHGAMEIAGRMPL